ncbi:MAG: acyltransferase [Solirubrobacterales bacterium]|nr:acyltransferase [Solirubrobacterales bacterium]
MIVPAQPAGTSFPAAATTVVCMPARARSGALDGLRGLAATAVVLLHTWMFDHGDEGRPSKTGLDVFMGELRLGVTLFFVLSGFLLVRPWVRSRLEGSSRPPLGPYLRRRAARVLPAYYLALVGVHLLLSSVGHPNRGELHQLPYFALFLQNQFQDTAGVLDPPMWTLAIEVSFYLLVPVLGWLALRQDGPRGRGGLLVGCGALAAAGVGLTGLADAHSWSRTATTSLPFYLPIFAAGVAAAVIMYDRTLTRAQGVAALVTGLSLVLCNGLWHVGVIGLPGRHLLLDLPAGVGFALLVAAVVGRPGMVPGLTSRPVVAVGTVSYGIYLWHFPIIQWLRATQHMPDDLLSACALTMTLSVVAGTASHLALERPVLRRVAGPREPRPSAGTSAAVDLQVPDPAGPGPAIGSGSPAFAAGVGG